MTYRVDLTPRAISDIEGVIEYIEQAAPTRVKRWFLGLMDVISSLEYMPERFSLASESKDFGIEMRQVLCGKRSGVYRIIFRIYEEEEVIRVICVRHCARDRLRLEDLDE